MKVSELRSLVGPIDPDHRLGVAQAAERLRAKGIPVENIYQELEMEYGVEIYEDVNKKGDYVPFHSHSFYELLYCQSGSVQYFLGTRRYRFQKGDIAVIPPGIGHCPLLASGEGMTEPYRRYVLRLHPEFLHKVSAEWDRSLRSENGCGFLRTAGTRYESIKGSFQQCYREAERQLPGWRVCLYGGAIQLLVYLARAFGEVESFAPIPEQRDLLDDIVAYVETHLAEKITLESTARSFFVSESTISQLFRKKLGVSFYRSVTQWRLIAAKRLISDGVRLEEIPGQIGFSEYSSFYRAFKREYGVSPQEFRKMQMGP